MNRSNDVRLLHHITPLTHRACFSFLSRVADDARWFAAGLLPAGCTVPLLTDCTADRSSLWPGPRRSVIHDLSSSISRDLSVWSFGVSSIRIW